jgi:hypothetical protein
MDAPLNAYDNGTERAWFLCAPAGTASIKGVAEGRDVVALSRDVRAD